MKSQTCQAKDQSQDKAKLKLLSLNPPTTSKGQTLVNQK